jgi:serine protease inhibitor
MTGTDRLAILCILFIAFPPAFGQESYHALVDANTRFAFKFFHQAVAGAPAKNVLISPTALSLDFALLQNGAGEAAKSEIRNAFDLRDLSPEQINRQSLGLLDALAYQPPQGQNTAPPTGAGERLILVRSLWVQPGIRFRPLFMNVAEDSYAVKPEVLPTNDKAAVDAVNSWAAAQTGGKLDHVLDSLEGDNFLLVDTTWFKGVWQKPFDVQATHPGDFTLLSGQKKSVPMMSATREFTYFHGPKFQAVRLQYGHAGMLVFLPDEDSSLAELEKSLTPDNWAGWINGMRSRAGYLELPRFKAEYRGDVKHLLEQMGVESPFDSFASFVPAVTNPAGAKLTRVLQTMLLQVDEKGTEIVSSGVIGGVVASLRLGQMEPPFRMIVNRPFFFAVVDNQSGALLYMGAVVNP